MEPVEAARKFWTSRDTQPNLGVGANRLLYETLTWIVPRLEGRSLLDIGSGEGGLVRCLRELTDVHLRRCDLNPRFIANDPDAFLYDINSGDPLPATDMASLIGVLIYCFDDEALRRLLRTIPAGLLFIRCPVTTTGRDVTINKRIPGGEQYAGCYRTLPNLLRIIDEHYRVIETTKVLPFAPEPSTQTVQVFIMGRKR